MSQGLTKAQEILIVQSNRSWWQARYLDGTILSEWDTLQTDILSPSTGKRMVVSAEGAKALSPVIIGGRTSRWEEVKKQNLVGLRLVCPTGAIGELECNKDYRFFQIKNGGFAVGMGEFCTAHIIGVVDDNGFATCVSYEPAKRRIVRFKDNVHHMAYQRIGRLNLDVHQIRL